MTPAEQAARDQDLHKVNALLGHWRGGINPCTCWRCQDVAAAIEQARREEREACIDDVMEHSCQTYSECCYCQNEIKNAIRARAQEQP